MVPMMLQPEEGRAIQDLGGTTLFPAQQASCVARACGLNAGLLSLNFSSLTASDPSACNTSAVCCLAQVAAGIVNGSARGDYHLRGPDVGLNLLVASMAGFSPRMYNWVLEVTLRHCLLGAAVGCTVQEDA